MNTKNPTPNPAPAIREGVVESLAEAEVIEFFKRKLREVKQLHPKVEIISLEIHQFDIPGADEVIEIRVGGGVLTPEHAYAYGETIDAAISKLIEKLRDSTPEKIAQEKRAKAAALIAEADALEAITTPTPTQFSSR